MPRKNPIPPLPTEADEKVLARAAVAREETDADDLATYWPTDDPSDGSLPVETGEQVTEIMPTETIRAVAVREEPRQHLIVGLAALAELSEADFQAKLGQLVKGQERLEVIVKTLLKPGEDYGKVPNVSKPFLHLPGAEKLEKFYGYAVRQEAERVLGDGITSPPFGYHVRSYIHLGDLDGPVIDQGYGEANVWEEKYRYRFAKAVCPKCGREGLIRGKPDGKLAGKWWCPGREGGCNSTFEPNATNPDGSLLVTPPGKVENTDLWGLGETVLLMASKRSFVHGIRRATGTSGYFTQDEDSPSVQQQASDAAPEGAGPVVETATIGVPVAPGGKVDTVTQVQLDRLFALAKEKGIGGAKIAELLGRLFGLDVEPTGAATTAAVRGLTGHQIGGLIWAIETGEVPVPTAASVERDDPVAYATHPDDLGAK